MSGNSTEFLKNTFQTGEKQARPAELGAADRDADQFDPNKRLTTPEEKYKPGPEGNAATAGGALAGPDHQSDGKSDEAAVNFGVKGMAPAADNHAPPSHDQARGDGKASLSRLADE